jgi:hypothetical protein
VYDRVPGPDKQLIVLTNGAHMPVETPAWQELCEQVGGFLRWVGGGLVGLADILEFDASSVDRTLNKG